MDANEYQDKTRRTWQRSGRTNGREIDMLYLSGKMAAEAGEVFQHIAKAIKHDKPLDLAAIGEELGDVQWYLARTAAELGLGLGNIMQANINKLQERHPDGDTSKHYQNGSE